ncbi:hypothetical protein [Streptomyces sp. PD-S100-1]|uniref:hypothetical protein n=1 Tax=Streptomyces sp. PD-S100-1 TaxID=3394351 RepID=UPI0039BC9F96
MSDAVSDVVQAGPEALDLPAPEDLTPAQTRGAVCVWCEVQLTVATAIDLGPRMGLPPGDEPNPDEPDKNLMRWYPRACTRCTADRAHRALYEHVPLCEQCVDEAALCPVGRTLYRLVREGRR